MLNNLLPRKCDRCDATDIQSSIISMFNLQEICLDCKDKEKKHPKYSEAVKADEDAFNRGNYNFVGIGLPPELNHKA
jgi:hypothetical protein